MGDWLDWLLEGDGVQQVTSMPCLSLRTATLLSSHYFDWHSLSCHFTSTHLGLWLKTALNQLRFMKTALAIMQPLLAMHCTETWLLLPGNLTGSVQILPFERTTRPRSVHSHFSLPYCIKRFIEPQKIGFHEIINLRLEFQYPRQWSRMWRFIEQIKKKKKVHKRSCWTGSRTLFLVSGMRLCSELIMGPTWESDRKL